MDAGQCPCASIPPPWVSASLHLIHTSITRTLELIAKTNPQFLIQSGDACRTSTAAAHVRAWAVPWGRAARVRARRVLTKETPTCSATAREQILYITCSCSARLPRAHRNRLLFPAPETGHQEHRQRWSENRESETQATFVGSEEPMARWFCVGVDDLRSHRGAAVGEAVSSSTGVSTWCKTARLSIIHASDRRAFFSASAPALLIGWYSFSTGIALFIAGLFKACTAVVCPQNKENWRKDHRWERGGKKLL